MNWCSSSSKGTDAKSELIQLLAKSERVKHAVGSKLHPPPACTFAISFSMPFSPILYPNAEKDRKDIDPQPSSGPSPAA